MPVNLIKPLIQANRQRSQDMGELGTMIKNIRRYNKVKKLGNAVAQSYFNGELDPNNPQSFGTNLGKIAEETGSSQAEVFHVASTFGKTLQDMQAPSRNIELAVDLLLKGGFVNEETKEKIGKQIGAILQNVPQGQSQPTENNTGLELQTPEQPTEGTGSLVETLTKLVGEDQNSTPEQNLYGLPQQADADRKNYFLPNEKTIVSSTDQNTYTDDNGVVRKLPNNAYELGMGTGLNQVTALMASKSAERELAGLNGEGSHTDYDRPSAQKAAKGGTGLRSNFKAAVEGLAGGLEINKLIGKKGFFPDNADNREMLRIIRQTSKSAFMNSARGAVYEQQNIEEMLPNPKTWWVNPEIEARKFIVLKKELEDVKRFNLKAISEAVDPGEITKLKLSNYEIDKVLNMLRDDPKITFTDKQKSLVDKHFPAE
jgi:hypothetical protein